jgi:hypothetical protein
MFNPPLEVWKTRGRVSHGPGDFFSPGRSPGFYGEERGRVSIRAAGGSIFKVFSGRFHSECPLDRGNIK